MNVLPSRSPLHARVAAIEASAEQRGKNPLHTASAFMKQKSAVVRTSQLVLCVHPPVVHRNTGAIVGPAASDQGNHAQRS